MDKDKLPTEPKLNKDDFDIEVFKPIWMPYNEKAQELCDYLAEVLQSPTKGKMGNKHRAVIASLLHAFTRFRVADWAEPSKKPLYLGLSLNRDALSRFPLAGADIIKSRICKLKEKKVLSKVDGSGSKQWTHNPETGKSETHPIMTMYTVDLSKLGLDGLQEAKFIEVGRPLLKVNEAETRGQREKRKSQRTKKPALSSEKELAPIFASALTAQIRRIQALNDFWRLHPMEMASGHAAACVTRVFHDGRGDAGGRLYGAWTSHESSYRLQATIDGQSICQIDIRGSQPTLLSALLGVKLNTGGQPHIWHDVYTELTALWGYDANKMSQDEFHENLMADDNPNPFKRPRNIAKGVIMEMIGLGNYQKAKPSPELVEKTKVTQEEWDHFSERLIEAIPALKMLEPRHDDKGKLSGYINGPQFLSYHESEMILKVIEALHDMDIPAYPVHDCIIVREGDAVIGAEVLRAVVADYCQKVSSLRGNELRTIVPLTIEGQKGKNPNSYGIHPDSLRGEYSDRVT